MEKKANILDFFYIIPMLFLIGIFIFVAFIITDSIADVQLFKDDATANLVTTTARNTVLTGDNMMLFIIIGLSIFVIVSAAVIQTHPAFFIISFIILLIAVTVAAVMSNAFWTFANSDSLLATSNHFPKIKFLFDKLPLYIAFMGMASLVAAYINRQ